MAWSTGTIVGVLFILDALALSGSSQWNRHARRPRRASELIARSPGRRGPELLGTFARTR
jgi:hypothetical protein